MEDDKRREPRLLQQLPASLSDIETDGTLGDGVLTRGYLIRCAVCQMKNSTVSQHHSLKVTHDKIAIPFTCPAGHNFVLAIEKHKDVYVAFARK